MLIICSISLLKSNSLKENFPLFTRLMQTKTHLPEDIQRLCIPFIHPLHLLLLNLVLRITTPVIFWTLDRGAVKDMYILFSILGTGIYNLLLLHNSRSLNSPKCFINVRILLITAGNTNATNKKLYSVYYVEEITTLKSYHKYHMLNFYLDNKVHFSYNFHLS